ncbi:DUF3667 domain-containing protein [Dyella tabacisoli]|uniref:DUF3667 domain-containing protein n=1 Tax=Dyella tabacisoli TaxID=2282381 RepID=A0A369UPK8_9GAMM|nr:DUF3667 domain-containing protein [Dyella tabacisoli]RDD82407.1 DUF3667 domain-containing protein [Dyella tabacisoli]
MKELTSASELCCANCSTSMRGDFCHDCGQSIHSVLKPVHGVVEDALEMVLHVDGRIAHTVPPLFIRPGFLTLEYFSGRRVRYVTPFRLMFILCLLAFFVGHIALDQVSSTTDSIGHISVGEGENAFAKATTPAEVRRSLKGQLAGLEIARQTGVTAGLDTAEQALRRQARERLIALGEAPAASTSAATPAHASSTAASNSQPATEELSKDDGALNNHDWGSRHDPVSIAWLPDFVNAKLDRGLMHLKANVQALRAGGDSKREAIERFKAGTFAVLPMTMFILMPVFALLLKVVYLFRRRLYMEHLIVALHSHAFLFLTLLLISLVSMFGVWLVPHAAWLAAPLRWIEAGLGLWAMAYLLLMQKRIYRQGWIMTVLKYLLVGWCYLWLLTIALVIAIAFGAASY